MKKLFFVLPFIFPCALFAQPEAEPSPQTSEFLLLINPLLVGLATYIVSNVLKKYLQGWMVVYILVPLLSGAVALLAQWLGNDQSLVIQILAGAGSVLIQQMIKQTKQGNDKLSGKKLGTLGSE